MNICYPIFKLTIHNEPLFTRLYIIYESIASLGMNVMEMNYSSRMDYDRAITSSMATFRDLNLYVSMNKF